MADSIADSIPESTIQSAVRIRNPQFVDAEGGLP